MAITVGMLRKLEITKNFELVAGEGGLDKTIDGTEILDFEFADSTKDYRKDRAFVGNSIVLTSFLYAKDDPNLVVDAVEKLIKYDVHALAYKPVIFENLPQKALDIANAMDFPIFRFGGDEFFEDVIINISNMSFADRAAEEKNMLFKEIISGRREENQIADYISDSSLKYLAAFCINAKGIDDLESLVKYSIVSKYVKKRTYCGVCEGRLFIVASCEKGNPLDFKEIMSECLSSYGIDFDILAGSNLGMSSVTSDGSNTARIIKEAYWCEKIAEIEQVKVKKYADIGMYKFIISRVNDKETLDFAYDYLRPVLSDAEGNAELLKTGAEYVFSGGDVAKTAEKLFCHKNTVRYRINKLQEKVDINSTEKDFYANLSSAVKMIYLSRLAKKL